MTFRTLGSMILIEFAYLRPSNPLRVLGEFLLQKSNELEGDAGDAKKDSE